MDSLDIRMLMFLCFVSLVIGFILNGVIIYQFDPTLHISKQTAKDICTNLTNNSISEANVTDNGKLICEIPSFDHTTNIIIRKAGDSP